MAIPILDQVKIQAQVLVPLLKAFQEEFGEERANAVARKALDGWSQEVGKKMSARVTGSPTEKMSKVMDLMAAGDALDIEMLTQTPDRLEFKVTGCRYADFYKKLGVPELGFLFACAQDYAMTQAFSPDLEFTRTQTIMQGASHCDFRYQVKPKDQL